MGSTLSGALDSSDLRRSRTPFLRASAFAAFSGAGDDLLLWVGIIDLKGFRIVRKGCSGVDQRAVDEQEIRRRDVRECNHFEARIFRCSRIVECSPHPAEPGADGIFDAQISGTRADENGLQMLATGAAKHPYEFAGKHSQLCLAEGARLAHPCEHYHSRRIARINELDVLTQLTRDGAAAVQRGNEQVSSRLPVSGPDPLIARSSASSAFCGATPT